ncbi:short-chain dehydrogenase [Xylariaceae sp. FL0255]|nr:short-chain dehydrogenase [Xylariaceae sp. FL0255]
MGAHFSSQLTQFFPPKPTFTEENVSDLSGKVYLVTGANTGIGKQLARLLYSKNGKVYLACRSESKATDAIEDIKKSHPSSTGSLVFLQFDLNDLAAVKAAAEKFLATETKLHVLFNNAGVQNSNNPPKTVQGYDHHMGINTLAPFLFTKLLTPLLKSTVAAAPAGLVRVVWVSSQGNELSALNSVGLDMENLDYNKKNEDDLTEYAFSKVGNWMHGVQYGKLHKADGIISISLNPGNITSDLYRENKRLPIRMAIALLGHPEINGAYTELYAGVSPDITIEKTGGWVIPFGRLAAIRKDLLAATKSPEEGGNGTVAKFWEWSEEQVKPFAS